MALAYRSSGTFVAANATTSGAIGLPAGLANGDILILPIHSRGTGNTVTTPSGYSRVAEVNITSGHRLVVFLKYVTNAAGEVAPNVTHSVSALIAGRLSAFSGGDATTPLDVAAVTDKHGDLATVTAKSITPVSAGTMAIWIYSTGDDNFLISQSQGINAYSDSTTTGVDGSLALNYELQTNAAATGTNSMTQSANGPDNWNTVTLALRPAAVAAATPSRDLGYDGISYVTEMAFGESAFAPTPTWTDVSAYVRAEQGITVTRGRNTEFSDVQTGSISFVLNNRDRRFDPDYSAGPYFGQLLPQTRVRLRVRHLSVNYPIFDGYIRSFDQAYLYPREAVAQVTAFDLFSRLATRKLPATLLQLAVLNDAPYAYFPFDEDTTLTYGIAVDLTGNGHEGGYRDLTTIDSFLPGEQGRKAKHIVAQSAAFQLTPFVAQGDTPTLLRTMEMWVVADSVTDVDVFGINAYSINSTFEINISLDATLGHIIQVIIYDASFATATITTSIIVGVVHVVVTIDSTGTTGTLYLNGQVAGTVSVAGLTFEAGTGTGVLDLNTFGAASIKFAHVALYEEEMTAAQVVEHYNAGMGGGRMQTVPERLDAIADYIGLNAAGFYDDTDLEANTYLAAANMGGTALSTMQAVMVTEQGRLFVDAAGILQAQGRTADMKDLTVNATVQATLSDSGVYAYASPDGIHIQPGTTDILKTVIYVSTAGGATIPVVDAAARALFDELEESISAELDDATAARNLGLSRLRRYSDPTTRIDNVTVTPHGAADVRYALVFGVDLGWRLTVTRTPQALGSALSKTVTVEGITHTLNEAQWITNLYLVPAQTVYTAQPWFVFGDATFGRFGAAAGNQLPY